ncbi:surfeit locus protein 6 [Carcharodon carcharias]|uniref:surfeit locus protein 6 n=1 Tax=Carcharodon carcharias TaxID=13397 RepID=UPI001B7F570B|nr:surfeit locus protein 6 [Carcharodon carcharias]XP_041047686.1 surfeit locus protein 6 [Carcharodon carcharias]
MADPSLAAKDKYFQSLGSKICASPNQEPRKRKLVSRREGSEDRTQPKKKRKKRRKETTKELKNFQPVNGDRPKTVEGGMKENNIQQSPRVSKVETSSFSTVNILRQRLHEKIQESRGQGNPNGLLPEELEKKRLRRKQEKERKKQKRKEMRMKKKQKTVQEDSSASKTQDTEKKDTFKRMEEQLLFNKVDVPSEVVKDKKLKRKEKRQNIKGGITPLTGKNYKQLLTRLEAQKNKMEELKSKDENKAKKVEAKMKWTNVLYKAEGLKIKDNEEMLKASLKRKEKLKSQRQKSWEKRTVHVVEKMQHHQNKRKSNIMKKKHAKIERKKDKARKKGRILPEDLKKAKL